MICLKNEVNVQNLLWGEMQAAPARVYRVIVHSMKSILPIRVEDRES